MPPPESQALNGRVRTCLWFDESAEAAARFYVATVPGSSIGSVSRSPETGAPFMVSLQIGGAPFLFLNGGPGFPQTPAASIYVSTEGQIETDRMWDALIADGGSPGQCGWLTDRFGVSWQVVPTALPRLMASSSRAGVERVQNALSDMGRIDIARLEAAYKGAALES
ncbi:MAG: VOC family protein [Bacteroidota bacterium]